jgi:hypothetical protein
VTVQRLDLGARSDICLILTLCGVADGREV